MIVPMKKVSIVVMDKHKDAALEKLRGLGVMHLEKKTVSSPVLTELLNRRTQADMASGILHSFTPKKNRGSSGKAEGRVSCPENAERDIVDRVIALQDERKSLQDQLFAAEREKQRFAKWGDVIAQDFRDLAAGGVEAHLYDVSFASYAENAKDVPVIVLSSDQQSNSVRLFAFGTIPNEHPYPIPEKSNSELTEEENVHRTEIEKIEAELASLSSYKKEIERVKTSLAAEIEFEAAKAGMESGGFDNALAVSWITGYVPASDTGPLKRAAGENGWAFYAVDPAEDDEVPTKLKNNRLAGLIYPLTDFLEMAPGYREADISGWFMFFFTLFFGMIFGDAAYGSILLLCSCIGIAITSKKGVPLIFKSLLVLSISNVLWGILTCSWFGIDIELVPRFLQRISLPLITGASSNLSAYNADNFWITLGLVAPQSGAEAQAQAVRNHLMIFCFTIALCQLSIAHIKGIIHTIRSPKVFAQLGQLGMIFGMYFVVLSLVVFNTGFEGIKSWQLGSLFGGFVLVFIFGNYEDSMRKALISSCSDSLTLVLGITNVFSDIMSYIRLWAVGLAGASIAATINGFVNSMTGHFVFFIFAVLLFVFGHCFNIVLNILAVLVHGVRLNTLEFSSHIGITWSGFAYRPFAKRVC